MYQAPADSIQTYNEFDFWEDLTPLPWAKVLLGTFQVPKTFLLGQAHIRFQAKTVNLVQTVCARIFGLWERDLKVGRDQVLKNRKPNTIKLELIDAYRKGGTSNYANFTYIFFHIVPV